LYSEGLFEPGVAVLDAYAELVRAGGDDGVGGVVFAAEEVGRAVAAVDELAVEIEFHGAEGDAFGPEAQAFPGMVAADFVGLREEDAFAALGSEAGVFVPEAADGVAGREHADLSLIHI